jgi:hypothetical protein
LSSRPKQKVGPPLYWSLGSAAVANKAAVDAAYKTELRAMAQDFDAQFQLLSFVYWTAGNPELAGRGSTDVVLYSALHKNAVLFFSAIEMTRRGFYGPACTLLRPIVESLVLAKYCALADDTKVFEKWREGKYVHLVYDVLNRVDRPALGYIRTHWKALHELVRATIYAQQIFYRYSEIEKEIRAVLGIIRVLLYWNYHLLTRHLLTPSKIYYTRTYGDHNAFEKARQRARTFARRARTQFVEDGSKLVREYCARWHLK